MGPDIEEKGIKKVGLLFTPEYKLTSILLMISWSVSIMMGYGLVFILPLTLNLSGTSAVYIGELISVSFGIPAIILNMYIVEKKSIGRIKSMVIGYGG